MKLTIEDKSAIILIVFSIALLLFTYNASALEKNGITVKLISNTDRCEDCKTVYNVCLNNILTSSKITDYKFLFSNELLKEQTTLTSLKSVPNITYKLDKTGLCYDVTISAKKSPFANIDNILCFGSTCFNEFVWWNSSCSPRYAITSKAQANTSFSINDSALFFNTQIWTKNVTGGIYVYNCSDVFVIGNETDKLNYEIVNNSVLSGNNPNLVFENITYHFDEITGTIIKDSFGVNNGTSLGKVNNITGVFGNGFNFNASNNINTGFRTPNPNINWTINFWIKQNGALPPFKSIFSSNNNWLNLSIMAYTYDINTSKFQYFYHNVSSSIGGTNNKYVFDNNFHLLTFRWNGTGLGLFIDGVHDASKMGTMITTQPGNIIFLGDANSQDGKWTGQIDEFKYYNRGLINNEILDLYNNGINNLTSIYGSENYTAEFCNYTFNVLDNVTYAQLTNVTLIGDFANFTNVNSPFSSNNITNGTHNFSVSAIGYYQLDTSLTCNTVRPTTNMSIALGAIPIIPPMNITNITGNICCPDWSLATLSVCYDNLTLYQEYNEFHCLNGFCENSSATRYVNCPYGCIAEANNMGDGCIVPNYQLDFMFIIVILIIIIVFAYIWKKK